MSDEKPIAYDVYQKFADDYAAHVLTKPHNAYYDRPAVLSLLPDVAGLSVLDAGCGPGVYSMELIKRGAEVIACDVSERMVELAKQRVGDQARVEVVDLTKPLSIFENEQFSVIIAPLCMDYIRDWTVVLREFARILKPGGVFIKSSGHPAFDAEYFDTKKYFSVEQVESTWRGFGKVFRMPSFRRSLEEHITPILESGLILDRLLEPLPTEEFKAADSMRYRQLMHRPAFLCLRARKPN